MSKGNKLNGLEVQLASSILFYDKKEMTRFFSIYDAISQESNIIMDGLFDLFVSYIRKFDDFDDDFEKRKQSLVEYVNLKNEQNPSSTLRDNFKIWFEKVLSTDVPMELADDILHHLVWEEFKRSIESIDKSDISFAEKLTLRPKMPNALSRDRIVHLDEIKYDPDEIESIEYTSGLPELDKIVKFAQTNFVVIAARPSVGKSAFMLQQAINNAKAGVKTLFVGFEMNQQALDQRILNYYAGYNLRNEYTDENGVLDKRGLYQKFNELKQTRGYKSIKDNLDIYVNKTAPSADALLIKIEEEIKANKYEVIFIDYLQLLRFNGLDEWASLRKATNRLKNLAFRTDTLIVTGSQVNRSSTERGLYLTDMFGSSSIEADTDVIIGLEPLRERKSGELALINLKILKNREGDVSEFKYLIDYSTCKFKYKEM